MRIAASCEQAACRAAKAPSLLPSPASPLRRPKLHHGRRLAGCGTAALLLGDSPLEEEGLLEVRDGVGLRKASRPELRLRLDCLTDWSSAEPPIQDRTL